MKGRTSKEINILGYKGDFILRTIFYLLFFKKVKKPFLEMVT